MTGGHRGLDSPFDPETSADDLLREPQVTYDVTR